MFQESPDSGGWNCALMRMSHRSAVRHRVGRSANPEISTARARLCGFGTVKQNRIHDPQPVPPVPGAVLVIQRWNSWVKVFFPDTEQTAWVDLNEVHHERVEG